MFVHPAFKREACVVRMDLGEERGFTGWVCGGGLKTCDDERMVTDEVVMVQGQEVVGCVEEEWKRFEDFVSV